MATRKQAAATVKGDANGIHLSYNECGIIMAMFPSDWMGSEKELEIVAEFYDGIEEALRPGSLKIEALREKVRANKLSRENFITQSNAIGDELVYGLASGKGLNFIKQQFPTRKFPRAYTKSVISFRDKIGLI